MELVEDEVDIHFHRQPRKNIRVGDMPRKSASHFETINKQ